MELYSAAFIGFIIISLILHAIAEKKCPDKQWIVRLIISALFYAVIAKWRIIFLLFSAATVWYGAIILSQTSPVRRKRIIVAVLLIINLGILAVTKYLLPVVSHPVLLPLGISYYTLMSVSYVVDVYGGKYECEKNPAKLLLYMIWFPQMLQGPINRYDSVSATLFKTTHTDSDCIKRNALLFMFGAFKKYAIANVMIGTVGEVFGGDLAEKPGGFLFIGAVLYALCQYADFSGGIDMMFAVSRLFGVEMDANFKQPYFARSLSEFWRRWHISLGQFMKAYVFFPFAVSKSVLKLNKKIGKKCGKHMARSVIGGLGNILVFFLVGLWHGPNLHFILWGLYNGVIIAVSDMCEPIFSRIRTLLHINADNKAWNLFRIARTFLIVCFAGYFDYIEKVSDSVIAFKNTLLHFSPALSRLWIIDLFNAKVLSVQKVTVFLIAVIILFIVDILKENKKLPADIILKKPAALAWPVLYIMLILLLMSFTLTGNNAGFMYAAF